jgi:hypothetical protein
VVRAWSERDAMIVGFGGSGRRSDDSTGRQPVMKAYQPVDEVGRLGLLGAVRAWPGT